MPRYLLSYSVRQSVLTAKAYHSETTPFCKNRDGEHKKRRKKED
jgi:hypothetical protein